MKPVAYPQIKTDRTDNDHLSILVTYAEGSEALRFCGESWCKGTCGLPALVIRGQVEGEDRILKAYSSMVACGSVMQAFRVKWAGEMVDVPEQHHEWFMKRIWL